MTWPSERSSAGAHKERPMSNADDSTIVLPEETNHGRRAAGGRLSWTVGDQVLSSGTNFALGVLVARMVNVQAFGVFTLVFATYQLALGIGRALVAEPLVVRHSHDRLLGDRRIVRQATGASLAVGLGLSGAILVAAVALGRGTAPSFVLLAAFLPLLLLQDCWRFIFFAAGVPKLAVVNDGVWSVAQIGALLAISRTPSPSVPIILAAWCAAGGLAAVVGALQAKAIPNLIAGWAWISTTRDLSSRFTAEFAIGNGTSQFLSWLIAAAAGVAAAGAVRAGQLLLGPPRVVVQAAYSAFVPEGVRLRRRRPDLLGRAVVGCGVLLATATAIWGLAFLALPTAIGHALLGASWRYARPLLLPLTIAASAFAFQTPAIAGLRVLAAAGRSLRARALASPLTLALTVYGAARAGALGASWGLAFATLLATVVTWWHWQSEHAAHRTTQPAPICPPSVSTEGYET